MVVGLTSDLRRRRGRRTVGRSVAEVAALVVLAVEGPELGRTHVDNRTGSLERS